MSALQNPIFLHYPESNMLEPLSFNVVPCFALFPFMKDSTSTDDMW